MGFHAISTQLLHNRPNSLTHTSIDRDQTVSYCTKPTVLIALAPSQLPKKSFYVLSSLSEGHTVFQPRLDEQYRVPLPLPSGRFVTLICSTSICPPRPPALAPSSPRRLSQPALWQDRPTSAEPPPNPYLVKEPKNPPTPYCTSPRPSPSYGTNDLASAIESHNTSPYRHQKCSSAAVVVSRTKNRNDQQK